MAWKQDLAKLKQQLGAEGAAVPAPKPPPKPAPKPQAPGSLEDEDAVFLSAMGLKAKAPRPAAKAEPTPAPAVPAEPEPQAPETFQEAVRDLKGLKPMPRGPRQATQAAPPPAPLQQAPAPEAASPAAPPTPEPTPEPSSTEPPPALRKEALPSEPEAPSAQPVRFQLAAGMALEVDGVLDLRGHSLQDAMDRLKDRLEDGLVLGWRSLQVILGPEPALHEGLLALLASGQTPMVARYAQAPVPMGGSQAWLLYFNAPTQS